MDNSTRAVNFEASGHAKAPQRVTGKLAANIYDHHRINETLDCKKKMNGRTEKGVGTQS